MERARPEVVRPIVFVGLNDSVLSSKLKDVPDAITAMSERFKRDCLWSQVRDLFLAHGSDGHKGLADLPDACFRNVVAFYQEPFDTKATMKLFCTQDYCCIENMLSKHCACSDSELTCFQWTFDHSGHDAYDFGDDSGGEGRFWLRYDYSGDADALWWSDD